MENELEVFCQDLENDIKRAYEESITVLEAEKLAAKFLHAQMIISRVLEVADLNARMRKSGTKAIRAAVYMEAATRDPKKPSDVLLENLVNMSELVALEQKGFDVSEVYAEKLQHYLSVFREAHVYFRTVSKSSG